MAFFINYYFLSFSKPDPLILILIHAKLCQSPVNSRRMLKTIVRYLTAKIRNTTSFATFLVAEVTSAANKPVKVIVT